MQGRARLVQKRWWDPDSADSPKAATAKPFVQPAVRPILIHIVHNCLMFREGLQKLLEAESGLRVAGQSSSWPETVSFALRLKADVLLIDEDTPGLECFGERQNASGERRGGALHTI